MAGSARPFFHVRPHSLMWFAATPSEAALWLGQYATGESHPRGMRYVQMVWIGKAVAGLRAHRHNLSAVRQQVELLQAGSVAEAI